MKNGIKELIDDIETHLKYHRTMGVTEVPKRANQEIRKEVAGNRTSNQQPATSDKLQTIRTEIGDCKRCKLCKARKNIVFGVGDPNAKLMFIGEGPGADEDEQGLPFVGRAGQLLTKIIQAMGLKREDVYIANCVKCLKYNAMIQLGNGQWERIGRLVRKKYKGTVRSIDPTGKIINKRVIGWHATKLANRSVYKLTYKSVKFSGASKCAIHLTGDHPVLTKRGYIPAQKLKKTDQVATGQGLSMIAKNAIYGMLLGDGHIGNNCSSLSFSHSISQEDYAKFKMDVLQNDMEFLTKNYMVSTGFDKKYPIIKCYTKAHRSLRILRSRFYDKNKRKIVPSELRHGLDPLTLAIWFLDDGYLRIRPPRQPSAEIATCAFSNKDLKHLLAGLSKMGIKAHVLRNRIHFDVKATLKISSLIAPYVPPSMRWKLHPKIEKKLRFNKKLFSRTAPETLYDKVDILKVKHMGSDKTFFCIDVKDTNNFVTTGGVVHNCRPPNNRNPEPDELETCMPFLMKQIEAIEPKVIVCLGAVAAKDILKTEVPISKLRGKFIDWNGRKLMPTFHPAFLLRNPNMKRPVWEDMQVVMKELGLS